MRKTLFSVLLFVYLVILFRLTVAREGCFTQPLCSGRVNLAHFTAYRDLLSWGSYKTAAYLFFGNIAAFVPLGFLMRKRGSGLIAAVFAGLMLSLVIEGGQYVLGTGVCETDDLILNTLGAFIGALAGRRRLT